MKTRILTIIPALALLGLLLGSCEDVFRSCLRGNGNIVTDTRELGEFSGVVTEGSYEVYYIPDTTYFMELQTDENLIPYIRDQIAGSTLYIDNGTRNCLRSEYPIRIFVHAPEIRLLKLSGSGTISAGSVYAPELALLLEGSGVFDVRGIDVLDLQILITGSGQVEAWGRADASQYTITGSGTISAQNLESDVCQAEITGSGTIYCHAVRTLRAIISGSGNIYYRGKPQVHTSISGSGSVNTMN
jgi:hypothetical protein